MSRNVDLTEIERDVTSAVTAAVKICPKGTSGKSSLTGGTASFRALCKKHGLWQVAGDPAVLARYRLAPGASPDPKDDFAYAAESSIAAVLGQHVRVLGDRVGVSGVTGSRHIGVVDAVNGRPALDRAAFLRALGSGEQSPGAFGVCVGVIKNGVPAWGFLGELVDADGRLQLENVVVGGGFPGTRGDDRQVGRRLVTSTIATTAPDEMFRTTFSRSGFASVAQASAGVETGLNAVGYIRLVRRSSSDDHGQNAVGAVFEGGLRPAHACTLLAVASGQQEITVTDHDGRPISLAGLSAEALAARRFDVLIAPNYLAGRPDLHADLLDTFATGKRQLGGKDETAEFFGAPGERPAAGGRDGF